MHRPPPAGPLPTIAGDGVFLVGKDAAPGTCRSTRVPASRGGYWERESNPTGDLDSIIANVTGPTVVPILPSDVAFKTKDMNTWTRTSR